MTDQSKAGEAMGGVPDRCPCCGSEAFSYGIDRHTHVLATFMNDHPGSGYVECKGCNLAMAAETEAAAVADWNRRAAPPPPAKNGGDGAREKALREAAAICERWAAFAQLGIDVPCDVETNRMLWYGRHQYAAQCRDEILALLAAPAEGGGNG